MTIISDNSLKWVRSTRGWLQERKQELIDLMEEHLRASEQSDEAFGQSEVTAMMLVDMLLAEAEALVDTGALSNLEGLKREHERMEIEGRHYSRFGDALTPVLRDVLGGDLPSAVTAAWGDLFWAVVGALRAREAVTA